MRENVWISLFSDDYILVPGIISIAIHVGYLKVSVSQMGTFGNCHHKECEESENGESENGESEKDGSGTGESECQMKSTSAA